MLLDCGVVLLMTLEHDYFHVSKKFDDYFKYPAVVKSIYHLCY